MLAHGLSLVTDGPNPGVELLVALDEAGFNHLAAPLALWRRGGRDLGLVQELLTGSAGGWALALTSLRDLYASGGAPEEAGGDFGPEARALGTMTARMHLALDRAFGRRSVGDRRRLSTRIETAVADGDAHPARGPRGGRRARPALRVAALRCPTIVTHGDFHLGRTARTDPGWVRGRLPCPGGVPPGAEGRVFRSPLADVADLLWSLHHVASVAATERDPTGRAGARRAGPGLGGAQPAGLLERLPRHPRRRRSGARLERRWCATSPPPSSSSGAPVWPSPGGGEPAGAAGGRRRHGCGRVTRCGSGS